MIPAKIDLESGEKSLAPATAATAQQQSSILELAVASTSMLTSSHTHSGLLNNNNSSPSGSVHPTQTTTGAAWADDGSVPTPLKGKRKDEDGNPGGIEDGNLGSHATFTSELWAPSQTVIIPIIPETSPPRSLLQRYILVFGTFGSVLLTAGVSAGYSPLKDMLTDDSVFAWLCPAGTSAPCVDQLLRFDLMFTLSGALGSFLVVPTGFLLDRVGPKWLYLIAAVSFVASLAMFGICLSIGGQAEMGIIVAFILMSTAGSALYTASFHVANVFPRRAGLITMGLNVAFDMSAMVFTLLQFAHQAAPVALRAAVDRAFFDWYNFAGAIVFVFAALNMPRSSILPGGEWSGPDADGNPFAVAPKSPSRASTPADPASSDTEKALVAGSGSPVRLQAVHETVARDRPKSLNVEIATLPYVMQAAAANSRPGSPRRLTDSRPSSPTAAAASTGLPIQPSSGEPPAYEPPPDIPLQRTLKSARRAGTATSTRTNRQSTSPHSAVLRFSSPEKDYVITMSPGTTMSRRPSTGERPAAVQVSPAAISSSSPSEVAAAAAASPPPPAPLPSTSPLSPRQHLTQLHNPLPTLHSHFELFDDTEASSSSARPLAPHPEQFPATTTTLSGSPPPSGKLSLLNRARRSFTVSGSPTSPPSGMPASPQPPRSPSSYNSKFGGTVTRSRRSNSTTARPPSSPGMSPGFSPSSGMGTGVRLSRPATATFFSGMVPASVVQAMVTQPMTETGSWSSLVLSIRELDGAGSNKSLANSEFGSRGGSVSLSRPSPRILAAAMSQSLTNLNPSGLSPQSRRGSLMGPNAASPGTTGSSPTAVARTDDASPSSQIAVSLSSTATDVAAMTSPGHTNTHNTMQRTMRPMSSGAYSECAQNMVGIDIHDMSAMSRHGRRATMSRSARSARSPSPTMNPPQSEAQMLTQTANMCLTLEHFSIGKQYQSPFYVFFVVHTLLTILQLNFYLTSVNNQLMYMYAEVVATSANPESLVTVAQLLSAWSIMLPTCSVLVTPFLGPLLMYSAYHTMFLVVSGTTLVAGALAMVPNLYVQYLTMLVFSMLRPMVWTIACNYVGKVFGFGSFGRLYGVLLFMVGCINFVAYGFNTLSLQLGSYKVANACILGMQTLGLVLPVLLYTWQHGFKVRLATIDDAADPEGKEAEI
ncbi:hypothetical protein BC828DRAFT_375235 [Blastocladiella britannica]|nr:hypothetical protein BC828DRAFT_375235 [Blastocladiella britannica]